MFFGRGRGEVSESYKVAIFFLLQHTKTGKIYQNGKNIPNDHKIYPNGKNIPNGCKLYQMYVRYTKIALYQMITNIPNSCKIYQMTTKYTK
jgi:hypothetical protein